jgi:ADP-ribosylglycohydrolase
MPIPHYRPINYIKTAILWSLFYLRKGSTYEEAVKDIILRGGDTRNNAAIVGALMGAAQEISEVSFDGKDEQELLPKIVSIVENAPDAKDF